MIEDELPPDLAKALSDARVAIAPPRAVEEATMSALRQRGLVYPRRRRARVLWSVAAAAAIVAMVSWLVSAGIRKSWR